MTGKLESLTAAELNELIRSAETTVSGMTEKALKLEELVGKANALISEGEGVLSDLSALIPGLKEYEQIAKRREAASKEPSQVDNVALTDMSFSSSVLRALKNSGITSLVQLARCRIGDVTKLTGASKASLQEAVRILKGRGIELREGRSYIEILKLRQYCAKAVSPDMLTKHGELIGYVKGSGNWESAEFKEYPKFYFIAYDQAIEFLDQAEVSGPAEKLKSAGFPTF